MANITGLDTRYFRIPLEVPLSAAVHGVVENFELSIVRVRDSDGAEGIGYTYTGGRNGAAVTAVLKQDIPTLVIGEDADLTEKIWNKVWWGLHYGGRGGPSVLALSALDIALWDLKAKRAEQPLWRFLGGYDSKVPCYVGGMDLNLDADQLIRQTEANLAKGYRAGSRIGPPGRPASVAQQ